ncbi:hypothetical protein HDU93_006476 [Gonapodya sp. JEL0774]|nr:hypothetical protein HDU93_006476 [Gonapodya sp. JEL0774]
MELLDVSSTMALSCFEGEGIYRTQSDAQKVRKCREILKIWNLPKPKSVYGNFNFSRSDPDNILFTTSETYHKKARRLVSPAFSIKYLNSLEPFTHQVWQTFQSKVELMPANGSGWASVNLQDYFQNMAFDIIGMTAFGESFGMVETGNHPVLTARRANFQFLVMKVVFPILSYIDYRLLPIRDSVDIEQSALAKVYTNRIALNNAGQRRVDILQMLIDYEDPRTGERLTQQEIEATTRIINAAGSETTGNAMTWVMYFLLKHPTDLAKLRCELDASFPDGLEAHLELARLKSLPFLDAVIKESMRMKPGAPSISREAPEDTLLTFHDADGNQSEVFVPSGTLIEASFFASHRSPQIWLHPDDFLPERWLEGATSTEDEEVCGVRDQAPQKEINADAGVGPTWGKPKLVNRDAVWPFSAGSRDCIGKNFALNEVRILVGYLVRRFDLVPMFDTSKEIEGATFITLAADMKGGLPVMLRLRKE